MDLTLNEDFWNNRYRSNETGWDIGQVSTPIKEYIDQLTDKTARILIPGAGNAYEAEYLYRNGFENIHVLDISTLAIQNLRKRIPEFPEEHLHCEDFFAHEGIYDLIIEQTFFCAIDPALRGQYATKMKSLLDHHGKLAGLLFGEEMNTAHPPFGGNREEYLELFRQDFEILVLDDAHNSIPPRAGSELFFILRRR